MSDRETTPPPSPEEDLAAAMAAERRKIFPASGDAATRTERRSAAWNVAQLRAAGWRILRQPIPGSVKR